METISFDQVWEVEKTVKLLKDIYGEGGPGEETVRWLNAAPNGSNRWYAAFDNGEPVAVYGLLPMIVQEDGFTCTAALCNNVGTVPSHRGRGLFMELGKHALNDMDVDIALGVPNGAALPGHLKVGWSSIGKLHLMSGHIGKRDAYPDEACSGVPEWVQQFETDFMVVRDSEWRKWRYAKPGQEYRISIFGNSYTVWKQSEERGIGIFSQMRLGKKQVMEASNDAVPFMVFGGIDPVQLWLLEGTRRWRHFVDMGFKSVLQRELIIYPPRSVDPENVRFDACDFDTF